MRQREKTKRISRSDGVMQFCVYFEHTNHVGEENSERSCRLYIELSAGYDGMKNFFNFIVS